MDRNLTTAQGTDTKPKVCLWSKDLHFLGTKYVETTLSNPTKVGLFGYRRVVGAGEFSGAKGLIGSLRTGKSSSASIPKRKPIEHGTSRGVGQSCVVGLVAVATVNLSRTVAVKSHYFYQQQDIKGAGT